MDCEHATTTLLWLYGEAGDEHLAHIEKCSVCQAIVAEHADVVSALGPSLAAVRSVELDRRPSRRWMVAVGGLAAAAVGLWLVGGAIGSSRQAGSGDLAASRQVDAGMIDAIAASGLGEPDEFELQLDDLDWELDELSRELEML